MQASAQREAAAVAIKLQTELAHALEKQATLARAELENMIAQEKIALKRLLQRMPWLRRRQEITSGGRRK
eukprot:scaffold7625_cov18-Tisochrysis_lutea.AAC.1